MVCNQLGFFQVGPPADDRNKPTIVSRILQPVYGERQCVNMFPQKFFTPPLPPTDEVNRMYAGWDVDVDRLFFANGLRDPWREATVSADGLDKDNTKTTQVTYESDGFHCSDLLVENGVVDKTVYAVQTAALESMKKWLE